MASKWRASLQLYLWNCIGKQSVPGSGAGATASFIPTCALCHMRQPEAGIEAVAFMPFALRDLLSSHNRKRRRVVAIIVSVDKRGPAVGTCLSGPAAREPHREEGKTW